MDIKSADDLLLRIQRANNEWVSILDALEDLIILETADGRVARCNLAAAAHLGGDVRSVVGKAMTELWRDDTRPAKEQRKVRLRIRGSDDWFEHTSYALPDGSGVHLLVNVNDRHHLEAVAEGINVSDNINFMVAGVRHELGNPLNSVKMAMSVLRERLPSLRVADIEMYLDRMAEQVGRMEYLLQLLRSFSASEVVKPTSTDLFQSVNELVALVRLDLEQKNVTFLVEHVTLPRVVGDARALQQILSNLVANAVDAQKPGLPLRIGFRAYCVADRVVLVMSDDGAGMTETQQKMLFRPFVSSKAHGTGLGLSIVRRMLSMLGASIAINSSIGVGTHVELSFVIASAQ